MTIDNQLNTVSLLGALVADSLALAPHWIYDPSAIEKSFGKVNGLMKPADGTYHFGQPKGGQTHLGHQTIVLFESLRDNADFAERLREFWASSSSYRDHATKNFLEGGNERSDELAGASRLAAVIAAVPTDKIRDAMQAQVLVTHSEIVTKVGLQFVSLAERLANGDGTKEAVEKEFAGSHTLNQAIEVEGKEPSEALGILGRDCSLASALPAVIYFLRRAKNYEETLIENVMAGGDSASRGLILGALLAVSGGETSIPEEWRTDLQYQINN
ncbi:ADP-ribosylglycohydrolase family protein [Puniceicoccaceae bacterium K14]|nr:ADP-ribosylglycohydrolase family protein [Puniceicoccaceae bacterium K14]